MYTLSNLFIFAGIFTFTITFILGFLVGNIHTRNKVDFAKADLEAEEIKKAKLERELTDFVFNVRSSSEALVPFFKTLEMVIHDAINELPTAESELVCSTYNYYVRLYREVRDGISIPKADLINFANIHVEYSKIVKMYNKNKKIRITDFEKISLN